MIPHSQCASSFLKMEMDSEDIVNDFMYNEVSIWQYLRFLYNQQFLNGCAYAHPYIVKNERDYCLDKDIEILPQYYKIFRLLPKNAILIWTDNVCHNQIINGKRYNPYLDYIIEASKIKGEATVKLINDYIGSGEELLYPGIGLCFFQSRERINKIENYEKGMLQQYYDRCRAYKTPCLSFSDVVDYYYEINAFSRLFQRILDIVRPKVVFLENYYAIKNLAICHACRINGIACVDYQHGLQDWPHMPYHMPILRNDGWEILPKYFFTWGKPAAESLKKYFIKQCFHKVVIAGKPDYFAWKLGLIQDVENIEELKKIIDGRVPICVALPINLPESSGENATNDVISAIKKSQSDFFWLIRKHPLYDDGTIEEYRKLGDKVETNLSSVINCHDIFNLSHHTVVGTSTTAYEAIYLHKQHVTTLFKSARQPFFREFMSKSMHFAGNVDELLEDIKNGLDGYPWEATCLPYIDTSIEKFNNALKLVCDA